MARMMFWVAVAAAAACGCRQRPATPSSVETVLVRVADASPPPPPAQEVDAGKISSPLLVARLDRRRAAILLDPNKPKRPAGTPTLLERSDILTADIELARSALSTDANARLASTYRLGAFSVGTATCMGRLERVSDLSRAVADDPAYGAQPGDSDAELAERAFAGEHSVAAIVALDATCPPGSLWAVVDEAPAPTALATAPGGAALKASIEPALAAFPAYRELPSGKDWRATTTITKVGGDRAWVVALRSQPGTPVMVCALFDLLPAPKVLASTNMCPESIEGVTSDPGGITLWFTHGFGRVQGDAIEMQFFPTAYTGTYGAW